MSTPRHHALVIGASGLIGWAIVNELLSSSSSPFSCITALVNRPLRIEDTFWPKERVGGPELALVSGVDLSIPDEIFESTFKHRVKSAETISHVFYFGTQLNKKSLHKSQIHCN